MRKLLVLGFALALTALSVLGDAYGQSYTLTQTIPNPAPAADEEFGCSVAGVGGNILVGANGDEPGGVPNAGSAYLFDGTTGALLLTIPNPAPAADDLFGCPVAAAGGNILVGAAMDDPGGVTNAGSAYQFDGATGALLLTIPNPAPADGDRFGGSVAALGGNILVGAFYDDPGGVTNAGSAYLFDGATGALLLTIPNPAPATSDYFGTSLAALAGNILVGAYADDPGDVADAGSAYLFSGSTGALLLTILNPAPAADDYFGYSVAAVGGNILAGAQGDDPGGVPNAGSAYLFATDMDSTPPEVTLTTPAEGAVYTLSQAVLADYACEDEAGGSGLASCVGDVADGAAIDTASVGPNAFTVTAEDNAANTASLTHAYSVVYSFSGFFRPVDNIPTLNLAKAGSAIPVKFSLSGNQGLSIFATGYPKWQKINCDTSVPLDIIEETVTAGSSSLSYDPIADQYVYVWKTDKAWAGTCRQLVVRLNDGTQHVANFKLK